MTKFVNLTPHDVTIVGRIIPASGKLARAEEKHNVIDTIDNIPIMSVEYGEISLMSKSDSNSKTYDVIETMPAEQGDTYYIVSNIAAHAFPPGRNDILVPGDPIRDGKGRIIGSKGLCRI